MRYMMLVYSTEGPDGLPPEEAQRIWTGHWKVMDEATMRRNVVSALKDACARMGSRYDVYHLRIEELGGG